MTEPVHGATLIQMHADIIIVDAIDRAIGSSSQPEREIDSGSMPGATSIMSTVPVLSHGFKLEGDTWVIGRDRDCTVRVQPERTDISRKHATIRREGTIYTLYDHSRHGTFVNNIQIVEPCHLDTADVIGLANTREMLRFINYDQIAPFAQALSEREHEVLRNLATGLSIKQIADELKISQNTVQTHLKHLYEKLNVKSREEAVAKARKLQLLYRS